MLGVCLISRKCYGIIHPHLLALPFACLKSGWVVKQSLIGSYILDTPQKPWISISVFFLSAEPYPYMVWSLVEKPFWC